MSEEEDNMQFRRRRTTDARDFDRRPRDLDAPMPRYTDEPIKGGGGGSYVGADYRPPRGLSEELARVNRDLPLPQTPQLHEYASKNPARLAGDIIDSVAALGGNTADQIDSAADRLLAGAHEIATKMREVAAAIRGHSNIASNYVAHFCNTATNVYEDTVKLKARFDQHPVPPPPAATEPPQLPEYSQDAVQPPEVDTTPSPASEPEPANIEQIADRIRAINREEKPC